MDSRRRARGREGCRSGGGKRESGSAVSRRNRIARSVRATILLGKGFARLWILTYRASPQCLEKRFTQTHARTQIEGNCDSSSGVAFRKKS